MREVKLNRIETVLADADYPVSRDELIEEYRDVTLILAEGEENLGAIISESSEDSFASMDEVMNEVMSLLPQHAVGEPYQSEGDS